MLTSVAENQIMQRDKFPPGVTGKLNWYVYRLIDPRNGETFYVGKGQGDRIFQHGKGALSATEEEDKADLKFRRIKAIWAEGLEVGHVIHRHNIENEDVAFQIEAALIDAYPGLTNEVSGHGSGDYGCRHVEQIVKEYAAEPFEPREPLILISIARSYEEEEKSIYDAVRGVWRISVSKAKSFKLVLAHRNGIVVGCYRPTEWLPATKENFSWLADDIPGRFGFVGVPAETAVESLYNGKRVPDKFRRKGAANPVRFISETASTKGQDPEISN
jgi:hypothetical protein